MNRPVTITVCIKQVPDTADVTINPETNTLIREGIKSIINPFDLYAIEESIRLKEKYDGIVTVISMGPPQVETSLREAVAMGVDDAYLLTDEAFAGADTLATALTIATAIKMIGGADIILMGRQAIDGDTGQVGPEVAEHLGIPHVTNVRKINEIDDINCIFLERLMEEGYVKLKIKLPVLVTVVKEINEPRLPSLKDKIVARKKKINIWSNDDINIDTNRIGLIGSPTRVKEISTPAKPVDGRVLCGDVKEMVSVLLKELKNKGVLINTAGNIER